MLSPNWWCSSIYSFALVALPIVHCVSLFVIYFTSQWHTQTMQHEWITWSDNEAWKKTTREHPTMCAENYWIRNKSEISCNYWIHIWWKNFLIKRNEIAWRASRSKRSFSFIFLNGSFRWVLLLFISIMSHYILLSWFAVKVCVCVCGFSSLSFDIWLLTFNHTILRSVECSHSFLFFSFCYFLLNVLYIE